MQAYLKRYWDKLEATREASHAVTADVDIPVPAGLAYLPYQRAGITYAMQRPATLIADEMGLGKTIQAIGVVNADRKVKRVLVICPASLRLNWKRELARWLVRDLSVDIVKTTFPTTDIVITNYDVLHQHQKALRRITWDLLVVDEAHYLKTPDARRTKQVLGEWIKDKGMVLTPIRAKRRLFLTGTPILNRPIEIYPILQSIDPTRFGSVMRFAYRYCAAYKHNFGHDMTGASNSEELQDLLRSTCMVRRRKADVLTELPPKRRQVIELPENGAAAVVRREQTAIATRHEERERLQAAVELAKVSEDPEEYALAVMHLEKGATAAFTKMEMLRKETAMAKVGYVCEHLHDAIDAGGKVVVFAHHLAVIDALAAEFATKAVKLDGRDTMEARDEAVHRFQEDDEIRLFIGGIHAAGVGLTLTAGAHVVFAELDWTPGVMSQAEDRCHRIGQTESVLVQHMVLEGSIDATMAKAIVDKQEVIDKTMDASTEPLEPVWDAPEEGEPATKRTRSEEIAEEAVLLTGADIEAVHERLRYLASVCDGAMERDGQGFNGTDTRIGKQLAGLLSLTPKQAALGARITHKYRGQLEAAEVV